MKKNLSNDYRNLITRFRKHLIPSPSSMGMNDRIDFCDRLGLKIGMTDEDIKLHCEKIFNILEIYISEDMPTVKELKADIKKLKRKGCKPYSKMKKAELEEYLEELKTNHKQPEDIKIKIKKRKFKNKIKPLTPIKAEEFIKPAEIVKPVKSRKKIKSFKFSKLTEEKKEDNKNKIIKLKDIYVFRGQKYRPDKFQLGQFGKTIDNIIASEKQLRDASEWNLTAREIKELKDDIVRLFKRLDRFK